MKAKRKTSPHRKRKMSLAACPTTNRTKIASFTSSSNAHVGSPSVASIGNFGEELLRFVDDECVDEGKNKRKRTLASATDEVEEHDSLCTTFCDLLVGLPSPPSWKLSDITALFVKVQRALERCNVRDKDSKFTKNVDLRGLIADEPKNFLITFLNCWTSHPTAKYVNVRVGCQKHGLGKGKLRDMLCNLLNHEPNKITWNLKNKGSIVSIKLDDRDYSSIGWYLTGPIQPFFDPEHPQGGESIPSPHLHGDISVAERKKRSLLSSSECPLDTIITGDLSSCTPCDSHDYGSPDWADITEVVRAETYHLDGAYQSWKGVFLCNIVCDFLFSFPMSSSSEKGIISKIIAGLGKCSGCASEKDVGDSCAIDLRGLYVVDAKRILIEQLNLQRDLQYLKVRVGCKKHGVGEGKLKDMVSDLLQGDQQIHSKFNSDVSIICIKLDGRKDYTSLNMDMSGCGRPNIDVQHSNDYEFISSPHGNFLSYSLPTASELISPYFSPWDNNDDNDDDYLESAGNLMLEVVSLEEAYKSSKEDFLCTIMCDFTCDVVDLSEEYTKKILGGLKRCDRGISAKDMEGSYSIDIRGRYVDLAKKMLVDMLLHLVSVQFDGSLNVRVGCKKHRVGKGKLKDAIIQWLKLELDIKCKFEKKDSIIRIKLCSSLRSTIMSREKIFSYDSILGGGLSVPGAMMLVSGDGDMVTSEFTRAATVNDFSEDFLCIIICDLLLELPTPPSWKLSDMLALSIKISAALERCTKGKWDKCSEVTKTVDLRGNFAGEAINLLVTALNCWATHPTVKYLKIRVGCKKHGIGMGKLKNLICEVLQRDEKKILWYLQKKDSVITIKLDGRDDYSSLDPSRLV